VFHLPYACRAIRFAMVCALASPLCHAQEHDREPRDRPDLREAWRLQYYGGPATADYLNFKGRLATEEVRKNRSRFVMAAPGIPTWRELGPNAGRTGYPLVSPEINDSGRATAILTHPTTATTLYVGYAGGGVWKCTNAQLDATGNWTWRSITDALPASSGSGNIPVGALAMEPGQPETLYLSLGDAFDAEGRGFYISTNGGDSWSLGAALGSATRSYAILPLGSGALLVGTNQGLFRSEDAGKTFTPIALPGQSTSTIWSIASLGGDDVVCAALSGGTGSLWYSQDKGKTWAKATLDASVTAKSPRRIALGPCPATPGQAWATFDSGGRVAKGLLKTTDKGHTWIYQDGATQGLLSDSNGQGFYNLAIAVDPNDSNKIFTGADNSVWRTLDGGASWARMTDAYHSHLQYAHADVHCTAWTQTGSKALIFGTDGGFTIFRDPFRATIPNFAGSSAPPPDRTFADSKRNLGISTQLIYNLGSTIASTPADSRYRIVTGHQDNGSRVRVGSGAALDASTAFDEAAPTGDGFAALIHPKDGNLMLTASYSNGIMKSTQAGAETTWADATTGLSGSGPFKSVLVLGLADPSGNTVYTFSNQVFKSTDFGSSWTGLTMTGYAGSITHVNAAAGDANAIAVVGGNTGGVTYNGGANWSTFGAFGSSASMSYVAFDPTHSQILYAASALNSATASHVFRSTNGGSSWQKLDEGNNGFPYGIPVHVIQVAPWNATEVYAGTDFGLYRSMDSGAHWERYGQGLPLVSTTDLYLAPDRSFIRVSTFGRGVWELIPESLGVNVTVTPSTANLHFGDTQTFTASVSGATNTAVTWSVQQGSMGGSVTSGGVYTAPSTAGTFTVLATSQEDGSRFGSATVVVTAPPKSRDLNKDGVVDVRDLLILGQRFGTADADADLDGDGIVGLSDLALLLQDL
jgi:photosystem II stability/assembly factor-like uncharacterized protein